MKPIAGDEIDWPAKSFGQQGLCPNKRDDIGPRVIGVDDEVDVARTARHVPRRRTEQVKRQDAGFAQPLLQALETQDDVGRSRRPS